MQRLDLQDINVGSGSMNSLFLGGVIIVAVCDVVFVQYLIHIFDSAYAREFDQRVLQGIIVYCI